MAEEEIGYSKRREGSCDLLPPLTYFLFKAKRPLVAYLQGREPPIFFFIVLDFRIASILFEAN